jgi:hypothetical protein
MDLVTCMFTEPRLIPLGVEYQGVLSTMLPLTPYSICTDCGCRNAFIAQVTNVAWMQVRVLEFENLNGDTCRNEQLPSIIEAMVSSAASSFYHSYYIHVVVEVRLSQPLTFVVSC